MCFQKVKKVFVLNKRNSFQPFFSFFREIFFHFDWNFGFFERFRMVPWTPFSPVYLSFCPLPSLSTHLHPFCLSIFFLVYLSILTFLSINCLSIDLSVYYPLNISICIPFIYLSDKSLYLFIYLNQRFIYRPFCLIYLSIFTFISIKLFIFSFICNLFTLAIVTR